MRLYLLDVSTGLDGPRYETWLGLVSPERRAVAARFHRHADAQRSVAGEVLARAVIAERVGTAPSALRFVREKYGKLRVAGIKNAPEFSISHSAALVACAVGRRPLGVDVERILSPDAPLIKAVCTPGEQRFLSRGALPLPAAFTLLWTLKESFLKASGVGIDDLPACPEFSPYIRKGVSWTFSVAGHDFYAMLQGEYAISLCMRQ